jgi:hydroxyethylthiazole kinase-like uncharacterized protein yjeF
MNTTPVYYTEHIRQIEEYLLSLKPQPQLMELAGKTIADLTASVATDQTRSILVIAGPGNNGGDAYVAARHLKEGNFNVTVMEPIKPTSVSPEKENAIRKWVEIGGTTQNTISDEQPYDVVIDGLFGIGLTRTVSGLISKLIERVNEQGSKVISIDIPSGLSACTGDIMGSCIKADHTVTFLGYKVGLHTGQGPDYSGTVHFSDLTMSHHPRIENHGYLIGEDVVKDVLAPREKSSHKGTHGQLAIIGGSKGMVGAALLCGRAAIKLGAGRVFIGFLEANSDTPSIDWGQPELMLRDAKNLVSMGTMTCFVVGPGLGTSENAYNVLEQVLAQPVPILLDADALTIIAEQPALLGQIDNRSNPTIMTPHPGEASRLLGCSIEDIQTNRVQAALDISGKFNAEVILKGVGSICAFPEGNWFINTTGNPGMASAGMGDVLAGIIAAFVAQGAYTHAAILAGVHLHGLAADELVHNGSGPIGMTASETIESSRSVFNELQNKEHISLV